MTFGPTVIESFVKYLLLACDMNYILDLCRPVSLIFHERKLDLKLTLNNPKNEQESPGNMKNFISIL